MFLDPADKSSFYPYKGEAIILLSNDGKENNIDIEKAFSDGIIGTPEHAYFMEITLRIALRLGIDRSRLRFRQHRKDELAHYSSDCWDLEFKLDGDWVEIVGISDRGQFDVKNHQNSSGQNMSTGEQGDIIPKVLEPAYGIDRMIMAILSSSYNKRDSGYKVLSLKEEISPYVLAILPLQKKDGLTEKAQELFNTMRQFEPRILFDDSGSIGRRYSRQDEIGTPYCITVDYDTLSRSVVTIRERDSQKQIKEVPISSLTDGSAFLNNDILGRFKQGLQ